MWLRESGPKANTRVQTRVEARSIVYEARYPMFKTHSDGTSKASIPPVRS
jgi:hypothetical protein